MCAQQQLQEHQKRAPVSNFQVLLRMSNSRSLRKRSGRCLAVCLDCCRFLEQTEMSNHSKKHPALEIAEAGDIEAAKDKSHRSTGSAQVAKVRRCNSPLAAAVAVQLCFAAEGGTQGVLRQSCCCPVMQAVARSFHTSKLVQCNANGLSCCSWC